MRRIRRRLAVGASLLVAAPLLIAQEEPSQQQPEPETEILGAAAAFDLGEAAGATVWVQSGTPLFSHPDPASHRLEIIDVLCELEVLEREGDWRRIRYRDRLGWVQPDLPWQQRSLTGDAGLETLVVEGPSFDIESQRRLTLAQHALGVAGPTGTLGPYSLMTDVADERLLLRMREIAAHLDTAYRDRYGLELAPPTSQSVALFATESGYREFEGRATHSNDLDARGHAGGNLAAMFVGQQRLAEAERLLVHELSHLANRRALDGSPPSWIEEGTASDLAFSSIDKQGRLRLGTLSGDRFVVGTRRSQRIVFAGPLAALNQMVRSRTDRRNTPIEELIHLSREEFQSDGRRQQRYSESTFLVRFLLEGERRRYAAGFRAYLAEIAKGESQDGDRLLALLETDWQRIERGLGNWLSVQSAQLQR